MRAALLICLALLMSPAAAVQPEEMLENPALEQRARDLSKGLRCLVCRNQSIDDSDAGLAKDLRVLVRERLSEGDSNEEVLDYVVARYGEYVLLKPRFSATSAALYLGGPLLLLLGGFFAWRQISMRPSSVPAAAAPLSDEERARVERLTSDGRD